MELIKFKIIKKNRLWIKASKNNFEIKLKANDLTETLEEGQEYELMVEDISVISKYGTDRRYQVMRVSSENKKCFLKHSRYNYLFVDKCKKLGGKYDDLYFSWTFSSMVEDEVDKIEELFNGELVVLEITAKQTIEKRRSDIDFMGYTIAHARSKNSGASLGKDVCIIDGSIDSGGSITSWTTIIHKGSKFRIEISKNLLDEYIEKDWDIIEIKKDINEITKA